MIGVIELGGQHSKRFWETVVVEKAGTDFAVLLDQRPIRTPAKAQLNLPTEALALRIAEEWERQSEKILPDTMPFTRIANSAIDKVAVQKAEVADMLAAYGDSDLLCYRAETPAALVARQSASWDPVLDWAEMALGARLLARNGVIHIAQPSSETAKLASRVHRMSHFELAGFHDLVALTGSLILGFAAIHQYQDAGNIWASSRVDEDWQIEQWGKDEEAADLESVKRKSFFDAEIFFQLVSKKA